MRTVLTGVLASAALVASLLTGGSAAAGAISASAEAPAAPSGQGLAVDTGIVQAADLSKFQPGNIISDAVFFNKGTMTEAQIQSFLQAKVPTCSAGYTCLKDYYDTARTISADAMCGAYSGGSRERASRIIYKVAQACGINPQVLLVMLQKEQGLVRSTAPSSWNYQAAMGQGCPDTAACDTRYYGLFNQLFWGAWQLKRYANPPGTSQYFTWYAPGKTWNIRWHPNAACGSSPVFIQNQATSDLYYYTPYQPNAAALRAGYGTGDGCSSYGNRNFYQYFTDWFGSTQTGGVSLVKYGAEVSIVSGDRRYGITAEAYPEYKRVFGAPLVVDAAFIGRYRHAGVATFYVRSTANGEVAMLHDGQRHAFTSCGLVAAWGGACGDSLVQLDPQEYNAFPKGALMTGFARAESGGKIHQILGTSLQPYFDAVAAASVNGGVVPYAAVMRSTVLSGYQIIARQIFAPGKWILREGDPSVWLPTNDGRLLGLTSWSLAAEFGLPASVASRVSVADTTGYTTDVLSQYVVCNGKTYFAASGGMHQLLAGTPDGFTATTLDPATCGSLTFGRAAFAGAPFVKTASSGTVYRADNGSYRPIPSVAKMVELNGGTRPPIAQVSDATLSRYAIGPVYLETGALVRADGNASVYYVDGDRLYGLPSWGLARAWGLSSTVRLVTQEALAASTVAGSLTHFVRCSGALYAAGGDRLSKVASGDAGGNVVTELSAAACAKLLLSGSPIAGAVFVTDGTRTSVATAGGFLLLPDQASVLRANGGTAPATKWVTAAYFTSLPAPSEMPEPGSLVRASNSASVTLLDGTRRIGVPNWGVPADLGIASRYRILPPATLATLPVSTGAVNVFVRCGAVDYVAAQGVLSPISATGLSGMKTQPLADSTCATLALTGAPIPGKLFARAAGVEQVYVMESGRFRALTAGESPAALNGGVQPPILTMDARTIAGLQR